MARSRRFNEIFERGSRAAHHVFGTAGMYRCPLCWQDFAESQAATLLSEEHVPPAAVGGAVVCLTCRACNNASGHELDWHLAERSTFRDFWAGRPTKAMPIIFGDGEREVRGEWRHTGERIEIVGVSKQNPPGAAEVADAMLRSIAEGDAKTLRVRCRVPWNQRRANLAWVRSAYLAAFALLGYRWASQDSVQKIRQQVTEPDERVFDPLIATLPSALPCALVDITGPDAISGMLGVLMNDVVVLMPPPHAAPNVLERLALPLKDGAEGGLEMTIDAHGEWPVVAEFRGDWPTDEIYSQVLGAHC